MAVVGGILLVALLITATIAFTAIDGSPNRRAIYSALQTPDFSLARSLIENGGDVRDPASGMTGLMFAALFGQTNEARRLLKTGSEVNARDKWGRTPLIWATTSGGAVRVPLQRKAEMTRLLIRSGADVDAKAVDGTTALLSAVAARNTEAVRLLLAQHADLDVRGRTVVSGRLDDWTPLTASMGHPTIRRLILDAIAARPVEKKTARG